MAVEVRSQEGALNESHPLQTVGLVLGVLGFTSIVFGAVLYAIDPGVLPLAVGNVVFGAACSLFYAVSHRQAFARAMSGRSAPLIALEVAMALGVLGAGFAINWMVAKNTVEWDLTKDGIFSLHSQSVGVAKRLDKPIQIYAFYRPNESTRGMLEQAVELYRMHTSFLELQFINPDRASAELLGRFNMNSKSARIVVADDASDRFTKIKRPTEEAITNALIQVNENRQKKVYFLTGHGEPSIRDGGSAEGYKSAATLLGNEGIAVDEVSLIGRSDVPKDADVMVVVAPRAGLLPNEVAALKIFLDRGGRVLALLEPGIAHGLEQIFRPYGVSVGDNLIVDDNPTSKALGFGVDAPVIQKYEAHPITSVMRNAFTMFYRVRSVSPRASNIARVNAATIVKTKDTSWAEAEWKDETNEYTLGENDLTGPVAIAIAVTKRTATHPQRLSNEARLVVFGDRDFANNRFSAMQGNTNLFTNVVNWLVGDEDRISIRPPKKAGDRLPLTQAQQYGIMFFSVNLLPLLIVGLGFSVWAVRRRK